MTITELCFTCEVLVAIMQWRRNLYNFYYLLCREHFGFVGKICQQWSANRTTPIFWGGAHQATVDAMMHGPLQTQHQFDDEE